jgi:hypothetical protein
MEIKQIEENGDCEKEKIHCTKISNVIHGNFSGSNFHNSQFALLDFSTVKKWKE